MREREREREREGKGEKKSVRQSKINREKDGPIKKKNRGRQGSLKWTNDSE